MASVAHTAETQRSSTASRAVAHSIQAKLKVGPTNDSYEQEADRVADRVVSQDSRVVGTPSTAPQGAQRAPIAGAIATKPVVSNISRLVNRKAEEKEEPQAKVQRQEEEEAQAKVQRQEEEEAQAKVQRQEEEEAQPKLQRQEEEEAQAKVQRQEEEEAQAKVQRQEEEEAQPKLQRQEEEEAQAKVQRQEEEEAQAKVQRQEEEEAQTKVQRQEEEEEAAQAKIQRQEEEEAQAKVQRQEEEEAQAKVQRQEEEEAQPKLQRQEEEEAQAKVQRQEEEEAQAKVQRQEEEEAQPKLQRQEEEEAQAKVQRQEEEEAQAKKEPRANVRDKREFPVIGRVEDTLFENKGRGEPLDDDLRLTMEAQFGVDFSKVRIHTGSDAIRMSREMKAQAFTHGGDIFFNEGKYDPESLSGKMLLAHELTHVVQQGAAEKKAPEAKIEENNAQKNDPGPDPADVQAVEAQEQTQQIEEQGAAAMLEGGGEGAAAPGGEAAVEAPGAEAAEGEAEAAEGEAAGKEGEEKEGEGKEGKAEKGKAPGKKGKGKGKKKKGGGKGVGAFLRQSTKAVFEQRKGAVKQLAANEKNKEEAATKLEQTEKAVVPPAEEGQSRANASQVETVEQEPEPEADEAKAKEEFEASLDNAVPNSLEQVDKFKEEGKGRVVGEAVKGVVVADTQGVQETYQKIEETPAPEPDPVSEELPPVEVAPETPPLAMGEGVVGEVQAEHTDLSEHENEADNLFADQPIPKEELEKVDEGDLAEAVSEDKKIKEKAKSGPEEVKQLEAQEKQKVDEDLKKEEIEGKAKMQEERQKELTGAQEDQKKTKGTIEEKRKAVTDKINGIYETANTTVQQKLEDLEKKSLADFDKGQAQATKTFEANVKRRIDAFKDRRYSGLFGWGKWLKDKLLGMDDLPEVKAIFDSEKANFITNIDQLIKKITEENKRVIQECKDIVANAKKEIQEFVDGLGPELKKTGEDAFTQMKDKLDALDKKINEKEKELQKKLAEKREAAIKAIEEKIEAMKEEMSGLVGKLGNLLLEAALKFFKWALKKAGFDGGQLMGIINKGKSIIKKIVGDPVAFIMNIVKAVKGGIQNFVKNIKKHLISGLISWLTGSMSDVPIQLPDKWDLKGIIHLILQVLGLTYERIRKKLVKRLGEKVVGAVEKTVEIIKVLITKGPIGLWEMLKEKAGEIKQQVMEGIRNWVIEKLVIAGVTKLVSFLNPAGAIVQAIIAIYNTVMFFVENWQRIVDFVSSVFNSVGDIAMGKLSAASQKVEQAMAMTIPIILNFLARLIGLGNIGKAVTNIIKKIRKPIDKVVDKVVDMVAKQATKVIKKGKAGAQALKEAGLKLIMWWKGKKTFKSADGGDHELYYKGKGDKAVLMVASSNPDAVQKFLKKKESTPGVKTAAKKANQGYTVVLQKENKIKTLQASPVPSSKTGKRKRQAAIMRAHKALWKALAEFSRRLSGLNFEMETDLLIKTHVTPSSGSKASSVEANPLTFIPGNTNGSTPKTKPPGWIHATMIDVDAKGKRKNGWVRGHMLSMHLHGPGQNFNMVPIRQKANSDMETVESTVRPHVKKRGNILHYKAVVTDWHKLPAPANDDFPKRIELTWGFLKADRKGGTLSFTKVAKHGVPKAGRTIPITNGMGPPPLAPAAIESINDVGRSRINALTGASHRFLIVMLDERDNTSRGKFTHYHNLRERMYKHQIGHFADPATLQKNLLKIYHANRKPNKKIKFDR